MFICGMVLRCAGTLKPGLSQEQLQQDLTTTVVHSYKLLINVKPVLSLTQLYNLLLAMIYIYISADKLLKATYSAVKMSLDKLKRWLYMLLMFF